MEGLLALSKQPTPSLTSLISEWATTSKAVSSSCASTMALWAAKPSPAFPPVSLDSFRLPSAVRPRPLPRRARHSLRDLSPFLWWLLGMGSVWLRLLRSICLHQHSAGWGYHLFPVRCLTRLRNIRRRSVWVNLWRRDALFSNPVRWWKSQWRRRVQCPLHSWNRLYLWGRITNFPRCLSPNWVALHKVPHCFIRLQSRRLLQSRGKARLSSSLTHRSQIRWLQRYNTIQALHRIPHRPPLLALFPPQPPVFHPIRLSKLAFQTRLFNSSSPPPISPPSPPISPFPPLWPLSLLSPNSPVLCFTKPLKPSDWCSTGAPSPFSLARSQLSSVCKSSLPLS